MPEDPPVAANSGDRDDVMPRVSRRRLPEYIRRNRERQAAQDQRDRDRYEAAIDAHITAHRIALDHLEAVHQWIADELDFDLVGETRPAAVWQMAGRCIGIARLMLDALQLGYCSEVLHLARALHEADRLVDIFSISEEAALLRRWLADDGNDWVRPREVREAEKRFEERLAKAMRDAGVPELTPTGDLTRMIYGEQSQAAHHRRRWTQDAVTPALPTMIRGRTTVWIRCAGTTASMLAVVEESVQTLGSALELFLGPGWYEKSVKPLLVSFAALREASPLR